MSAALTLIDKQRNAFGLSQLERYSWPYPYQFRPPESEEINSFGVQPVPNYGIANQVIICQWQVPVGYTFILRRVAFWTNAASYVDGRDLVFTLDFNTSVTAPLANGTPLQGWQAVPFSVGTANEPYRDIIFTFEAQQIIRLKAYSIANVSVGSPNYIYGLLGGFQFGETAA